MNCAFCRGPVDVSCRYGESLRCGCGRTETVSGKPDQRADLKALLALLRENRVTAYTAAGVTIQLSPESWRTDAPAAKAGPEDEQCMCGHAIHEHTQAGCVLGCDIESCGREESKA